MQYSGGHYPSAQAGKGRFVPEDREAGARLRRFVLTRMAARNIETVADLAYRADIGRDTLQKWWLGRPPSPRAGEKVARALGLSYIDLLNAREGRRPEVTKLDASVGREIARSLAPEVVRALEPMLEQIVDRLLARQGRSGRGH